MSIVLDRTLVTSSSETHPTMTLHFARLRKKSLTVLRPSLCLADARRIPFQMCELHSIGIGPCRAFISYIRLFVGPFIVNIENFQGGRNPFRCFLDRDDFELDKSSHPGSPEPTGIL